METPLHNHQRISDTYDTFLYTIIMVYRMIIYVIFFFIYSSFVMNHDADFIFFF